MADVPKPFEQAEIRLWGAFNPAIVTPDWLHLKNLIESADREYVIEEGADRMIASSVFAGGRYPWVQVEVSRESLQLLSTPQTETGERIRELAVGLLNALPETPVAQVELSHRSYVALGEERWARLATLLAPKEHVLGPFPGAELETLEYRSARDNGHADLVIEPSYREGYDLYVEYERMWKLADPPGADPAQAVAVLDEEWATAQDDAAAIVKHLVNLA